MEFPRHVAFNGKSGLSEVFALNSVITTVKRPFRRSAAILLLGLASLFGDSATAEERYSDVLVSVRAVRAEDPVRDKEEVHPHIQDELSDISKKLEKLPYKRFLLMSKERFSVPLMKKHQIQLAGHRLTVRPMAVEQKKVALFLYWQDNSGSDVLKSKLYLMPGESMLAGTDHSSDSGIIMAIDVTPVEP